MQKLPPLSYDLVKELNVLYPPVLPKDDISDRELWGRIYQRRLVEHLLSLAKVPPIDPLD
jgi:hypothetical protein